MDKRISRTLAATLAAATLAGGTAAPAMADQPTAGGAATSTGQRTPIAGLTGVTARWRDAKGGTGVVTGFDPASGKGGDVPAGTTAVTLADLPDGWTQSVSKDDPLTVTLVAPDPTQSRTYTFRAVSAADRFKESLKRAETIRADRDATDAYDEASLGMLDKAIGDARKLDADITGDQMLAKAADGLDQAVAGLRVVNWTFHGQALAYDVASKTWTPATPLGQAPGTDEKITGGSTSNRIEVSTTAAAPDIRNTLAGVTETNQVLTASHGGESFRIPIRIVQGTEITLKDGTRFTGSENGSEWTVTDTGHRLDRDNMPVTDKVELSDGSTLPVAWGKATLDPSGAAGPVWTMSGKATRTLDNGQTLTVNLTASRAWNAKLSIGVEHRTADGNTTAIKGIDLEDATAADTPLDVTLPTLPYAAAGDQYTPAVTSGDDATVTLKPTGLGDDGMRVFTGTIRATRTDGTIVTREFTIRQPFEQPSRTVDAPDAALDGLLVNGKPIQGWDPDILEYTITAGEDDKVTVSPRAKAGQMVKASDTTLTAHSTVQHWTVTGPDGGNRTYTVTLVRDHRTPTADEAFKPSDPKDMGGTREAPGPDTATLKSVGWTKDGTYHAEKGDEYLIPEGGSFAYESYLGQIVKITPGRDHGMTWKYRIGVLAPDGVTYRTRTVTVTYLTEATHRAGLAGLSVDGRGVDGFSPDRLEYTVGVANPERYVVTPSWDKQTGMSVTKHVDGADTTLTVTSADGLTSVVYKVHVEYDAGLAATGAGVTGVIMIAVAAVLASVGAWFASRHKPHDPDGDTDATM